MSTFQVVTSIAAVVLVIIGSYYCTRLLATKTRKGQRGGMIQLLDRFSFAKDKSFLLVEVCGRVYLVAESTNAIALIDELDMESLDDFLAGGASGAFPGANANISLSSVLSTAAGSVKKKFSPQKDEPPTEIAEIEIKAAPSFEMYLHKKISEEQGYSVQQEDGLDLVYDRIQRRKEKSLRDIGPARRPQNSAPEEGPPR